VGWRGSFFAHLAAHTSTDTSIIVPFADFYCPICKEDYELKGKGGSFGSKIVDGAFKTTVERLKGNLNPNLFLLAYSPQNYEVFEFLCHTKVFLCSPDSRKT